MHLQKALVVLDLETTGTWVEKDRIIEIAMIRLSPGGDKELFHKRVNPQIPIPGVVSRLTGITDEDVKNAPAFKDIVKEAVEFLQDADIGGFNVEKFDMPLFERECLDAGVPFSFMGRSVFDAQKIFHVNEKRDLSAAYSFYCGKPLVGAHAAMADTEATLEVLQAQIDRYCPEEGTLGSLGKFNYREQTEFFDVERKFRWWNGELYMMFGKYARKESLRDIVRKDPGYLEWMLTKDFGEEVKELVAGALRGHFPKSPEDAVIVQS